MLRDGAAHIDADPQPPGSVAVRAGTEAALPPYAVTEVHDDARSHGSLPRCSRLASPRRARHRPASAATPLRRGLPPATPASCSTPAPACARSATSAWRRRPAALDDPALAPALGSHRRACRSSRRSTCRATASRSSSGPNGVMPLDAGAAPPDVARRSSRSTSTMSAPAARRASCAPSERFDDRRRHGARWRRLNHPDPVYGYRLEHGGQVDRVRDRHRALRVRRSDADAARRRRRHPDLRRAVHARGVSGKVGWGHSTWAAARRARARGRRAAARAVPPRSASHRRAASRRSRPGARERSPGTVAAREGMVLVARDAERARGGMSEARYAAMLARRR